jgi:hypothetical protein
MAFNAFPSEATIACHRWLADRLTSAFVHAPMLSCKAAVERLCDYQTSKICNATLRELRSTTRVDTPILQSLTIHRKSVYRAA